MPLRDGASRRHESQHPLALVQSISRVSGRTGAMVLNRGDSRKSIQMIWGNRPVQVVEVKLAGRAGLWRY